MDFKDIVMSRYAVKEFDGKTLPEDKIAALKELIRFSPSSFNVQPWKIKIVTDPALREKLRVVSWNQPQVTSCSHLFVFLADTDVDPRVDALEKQARESGVPKEKIEAYFGMMRGFLSGLDADKKLIWAQKQIYIAMSNGLNGAKALGFDSCPMEGFDPKAYSEILGLPDNLVPTLVMPVGQPKDTAPKKFRFPEAEIYL